MALIGLGAFAFKRKDKIMPIVQGYIDKANKGFDAEAGGASKSTKYQQVWVELCTCFSDFLQVEFLFQISYMVVLYLFLFLRFWLFIRFDSASEETNDEEWGWGDDDNNGASVDGDDDEWGDEGLMPIEINIPGRTYPVQEFFLEDVLALKRAVGLV